MAHEMMLGKDIFGHRFQADQECKIKKYNFKKPDKFSKDQIRTISIIHETFARLSTSTLSAMLRSLALIHVAAVDQLTYEEFIRSVPNPTCLGIVNMNPLKGMAVLEIDPSLTCAIIDRLLGGRGDGATTGREYSEIEMGLIEGVLIRLLGGLREAWTPVFNLAPLLGQIETNPQFAQIVPPTEMVVLISLEAKIGEAEGMINFCVPYITIEAIMSRLTAVYMYSTVKRKANVSEVAPDLMFDIKSEALVCVSGERISLERIGALKKGDRIRLPEWKDGGAFIRSGGVPVLNLTRQARPDSQGLEFSVEPPVITKLEFLESQKAPPEADLQRIEEPLIKMSDEIRRGFESLQKKMSELSSWQESVADQLEYGGPPTEIPEHRTGGRRPFAVVTRDNVDWLASVIGVEHPQLIGMILSFLSSDLASDVIGRLPESIRPDIIKRIGTIERIAPHVIQEVERTLEKKMRAMPMEEVMRSGGIDTAVGILNYATRSIEKQIIEYLEDDDPELAEEIKRRMFVFEDIVLLQPEGIPKIYHEAGPQQFAVAMKGIIHEVHDHIFKCLNEEDLEELKSELEQTKPMRLSDVETVQQTVVSIIRRLEQSGEIIVARADEKLV